MYYTVKIVLLFEYDSVLLCFINYYQFEIKWNNFCYDAQKYAIRNNTEGRIFVIFERQNLTIFTDMKIFLDRVYFIF